MIYNFRKLGITFCLILLTVHLLLGQQTKPNFLIILGDDISATNIGCYKSKNIGTTPNIDQLSEEGIRFTNMFVSEAMCAPTRAELYTGLMPYKNGCTINHASTNEGTLSIVQHLEKCGYRVGLTGKRHFAPNSVYPFEFIDGFTKNCNLNGKAPENWDGVEEFINRNPEQPFCLIICSVHAHAPWDAGDSNQWELNEIVLPKNLVDNKVTREYFREYLAEIKLFDEQVGTAREILQKNKLEKNTAFIVLDENGAGMPCGKWSTYDWGVRSACVMKWPEPYNHKLVTPAIAQYCDILPTLIDAAGGSVPSNLDGKSLLPIIRKDANKHREYAFFLFNSGNEGSEFATRAVTDGRYKLIWNLTPDNLYAIRTINGFDYGSVDKIEDRHVRKMYLSWLADAGYDKTANDLVQRYRKRPEFQLFDLNNDPEEMNNLAEQPEYKLKIEELKKAIQKWMKEQGDISSI
jgi:uncharacterized sulfatase